MPRLLDLFCGAGGAAMGYHRAGFEVVGIDHLPQAHYPFEFIRGDALSAWVELMLPDFDVVHASPPCQAYSRLRHLPWLKDREYPELIDATREMLVRSGVPWVIENVEDAPLGRVAAAINVCGYSLTGNEDLTRHRRFESNVALMNVPHRKHVKVMEPGGASLSRRYRGSGVTGVVKEIDRRSMAGHFSGIERARRILGIDWMTRDEMSQAIPPAYTEFIGGQLRSSLTNQVTTLGDEE